MNHASVDLVSRIEALFSHHGASVYLGSRREAVTALQHALQCAQLAEWAGADTPLVAAAFLHDVGHFSDGQLCDDLHDDRHETRALPWLVQGFGNEVLEPIRLHVAAKRYLVATVATYADNLSPASRHSLELQGGAMQPPEVAAFEAQPFWDHAVMLRRWDDAAKEPTRETPPLDYYLALLRGLVSTRRGAVAG